MRQVVWAAGIAVIAWGAACSSASGTSAPAAQADAEAPADDAGTTEEAAAPLACTTYAADAKPLRDGAIFTMSQVYVDRDRTPSSPRSADAWKSYGFDLDGVTSDPTSTAHCIPVAGADPARVKTDGNGGIDNAFGESIAPIIASFDQPGQPDWVQSWNKSLKLRAGLVLAFPSPEGASYPAFVYQSADLCATSPAHTPRLVPIDVASLLNGDIDKPVTVTPNGALAGDVWTSGLVDTLDIVIPVAGGEIPARLHKVKISMKLSADRKTVTEGVLGGIANTEELVASLKAHKGFISGLACIPGAFDQYEAKISQASDIMDDGTQDPQKTCNGISVGLGFDMTRVAIGSLETPVPAADPCAK